MFDDIQPNQQPKSNPSHSTSSGQAHSTSSGQAGSNQAQAGQPPNQGNHPSLPKVDKSSAETFNKSPINIPTPPAITPSQPEVKKESASKNEPEDIFADIDKTDNDYSNQLPDTKKLDSFEATKAAATEMPGLAEGKKSKGKITIILIAVLFAAIGAAWATYTFLIAPQQDASIDDTGNEAAALPTATTNNANINTNKNQNLNTNTAVIIEQPTDTDGDGLTDEDEAKFGTDPELADTDGDGLTDQEEIIKYKTNPNNTDSDSDGYLDGEEVRNGYNPNGEGKLMDAIELP